jgi:hypothetical protein
MPNIIRLFLKKRGGLGDYHTLLHEGTSFCPSVICFMEQNSSNLAQHLSNVLQLKPDDNDNNGGNIDGQNIYMSRREIIDMQHNTTQHNTTYLFLSVIVQRGKTEKQKYY